MQTLDQINKLLAAFTADTFLDRPECRNHRWEFGTVRGWGQEPPEGRGDVYATGFMATHDRRPAALVRVHADQTVEEGLVPLADLGRLAE